jgi:hypothetical protein
MAGATSASKLTLTHVADATDSFIPSLLSLEGFVIQIYTVMHNSLEA